MVSTEFSAGLINHLWQSTAVVGVAWLLAVALRKNHARVRYWVWMAASVKFLLPFSLLMTAGEWVRSFLPAHVVAQPAVANAMERMAQPFAGTQFFDATTYPVAAHHANWLLVLLLAVWVCGALAVAGRFACGWWRVYAAKQAALRTNNHRSFDFVPAGRDSAQDDTRFLIAQDGRGEERFEASPVSKSRPGAPSALPLGVEASVPVLVSRAQIEPGIFGMFRPVLLVPEGILERLTAEQMRAIVAHEMEHVRRQDNLTFALHMMVEALFWFHPAVWWIGARLIDERERACDEAVLLAAVSPQDYAESIVAVCRYCLKAPLACVSGITGSNLKRRVESIMLNRNTQYLNFGRRLLLAAAGFIAVALPLAVGVLHILPVRAQLAVHQVEFDAASVKPSNPNSGSGTVVSITPGGRLHVVNATLKDLIETAYDIRSFQIEGGPKWADAARYDVDATPGVNAQGGVLVGWTNVRFEVQALLKDRFQLQLHRETKNGTIYSLAIAKGGIKSSTLSATQSPQKGINAGDGSMLGEAASMAQLAYKLSRLLGRPVVDNTGLEGSFDFKLEWTSDLGATAPDSELTENSAGPSIFTAIQEQLGLRLEASRGPVDFLVIDHVEKPSAN